MNFDAGLRYVEVVVFITKISLGPGHLWRGEHKATDTFMPSAKRVDAHFSNA